MLYISNISLFEDKTNVMILCRQMLRELIPGDLVKVQSSNDWKRSIIAAYNQDAGEIYIISIKFKCILF